MEIKIGQFRTMSAKEMDAILSKDSEIIILVTKRPRFTLVKFDNAPVALHNKPVEGKDDANREGVEGHSRSIEAILADYRDTE